MAEYYSFFSQYLNMLTIIWGGTKMGLLSFAIALILLIIFRKIVLVRRRYPALRYIAGSYYIIIPVMCLCFGFIFGAIINGRNQLIERLPAYQAAIQKLVDQQFNFSAKVTIYSDKSLDASLDGSVAYVQRVMIAELKQAEENQNVAKQFILTVFESPVGISLLKSQLKDKVSSSSGVERALVDEVFEIKLSKLYTSETIIKIFSFYIKHAASSLLIPFMILWVILLLIPLIEIFFAYRYNKRYEALIRQS